MNTSCAFPKAVSDDHYWSTQVNCVQTVVPSSAISSTLRVSLETTTQGKPKSMPLICGFHVLQ